MASKKSSAVPKRPTAATLAPNDSRYLGRNFFQSSSPRPTKNTAPEAAVTLRSNPRESFVRSSMLTPRLLFSDSPASICLPSAERAVRLSALHHFFAVRIKHIVDDPLCCVDFVVVLEI